MSLTDKSLEKQISFKAMASQWANWKKIGEKHQNWRRLENHVFPKIELIDINELNAKIILDAVLRPLENIGSGETANRVLGIIGQVFTYGINADLTKNNPTTTLSSALSPIKSKHLNAVTNPDELQPILRTIDNYQGYIQVKIYMQILPHIFLRAIELRSLHWTNIKELRFIQAHQKRSYRADK